MEKVDYQKQLGEVYKASASRPTVVETPVMKYLMVDGAGSPSGEAFQEAVQTLYPVAYLLKFMVRDRLGIDYGVLPLEVQWRVNREQKGEFQWTTMLAQPSWVTPALFEEAVQEAAAKKNPPRIKTIRLGGLDEGLCVQMLHRGPYERMNETLEKMLAFVKENGFKSGRDTHDIYLNSIKKAKPENLKTIMRLQVE